MRITTKFSQNEQVTNFQSIYIFSKKSFSKILLNQSLKTLSAHGVVHPDEHRETDGWGLRVNRPHRLATP
jgi:hypothetical protein